AIDRRARRGALPPVRVGGRAARVGLPRRAGRARARRPALVRQALAPLASPPRPLVATRGTPRGGLLPRDGSRAHPSACRDAGRPAPRDEGRALATDWARRGRGGHAPRRARAARGARGVRAAGARRDRREPVLCGGGVAAPHRDRRPAPAGWTLD